MTSVDRRQRRSANALSGNRRAKSFANEHVTSRQAVKYWKAESSFAQFTFESFTHHRIYKSIHNVFIEVHGIDVFCFA